MASQRYSGCDLCSVESKCLFRNKLNMPAGTNFNEQHDIEFRQIVLLFSTALWLGLEWLYLDSTKHIQFSIIRAIYYFFVGIVRAEGAVQKDNTDFDIEIYTGRDIEIWRYRHIDIYTKGDRDTYFYT